MVRSETGSRAGIKTIAGTRLRLRVEARVTAIRARVTARN